VIGWALYLTIVGSIFYGLYRNCVFQIQQNQRLADMHQQHEIWLRTHILRQVGAPYLTLVGTSDAR
jgi:hypothetical protein